MSLQESAQAVITARHAADVLGFLGHGTRACCHPGRFIEALLCAVAAADADNVELLRQVYPGYVAALELATDHTDGIDILTAHLD